MRIEIIMPDGFNRFNKLEKDDIIAQICESGYIVYKNIGAAIFLIELYMIKIR